MRKILNVCHLVDLLKFGLFLLLISVAFHHPRFANAQQTQTTPQTNNVSSDGMMPGVHLTRDRVYDSEPILKPQSVIWKTEGLFVIQDSYITTLTVVGVPGNPSFAMRLPTLQNFTDPVLAKQTIFFALYTKDGYLVAHDATTGKVKWSFKQKKYGLTAPVIANDLVFVGANNGTLLALKIDDGKVVWSFDRKAGQVFTVGPAVSNGVVYYTSSEASEDFQARADGRIYALDAGTGQQKWIFRTKGSLSSPALAEDKVYVGSSDGYLFALNAETGSVEWKFKVSAGAGPPAVMKGTVYFASLDGDILAVNANDGTLKWKAKNIPQTTSVLAVSDGFVYYSGVNNGIFALDASSGQLKWGYKTKNTCRPPVVAGGLVYFGSYGGYVGAVDGATGEEKWTLTTTNAFPSSPILVDKSMYFVTSSGSLYSVR